MAVSIDSSTLAFLSKLEKNNARPWFQDNKEKYELANANAKTFLAGLVDEMNKHDKIEKSKLFRIYRDVRFSKDKTPYNPSFRMSMGREKPNLRGGYYLAIHPKKAMLGAGFWNPSSPDLRLIRDHLAQDSKPLKKLIASKSFIKTFGSLEGDKVKTAPKGFDKNHPNIEFLKYKQFLVYKEYNKKEIMAPSFAKAVVKDFKAVLPFFNYMSDILGHDLNGVPLY